MTFQKMIALGLFFLTGAAGAKTIQVGGEQNHLQERSNPCWSAAVQPIIFVNGLKVGHQPVSSVVLGLTATTDGVVCGACDPAGKSLTEEEKSVEQPEDEKPVMVWYKEPKTNKKILVNGKYNDLDEDGNLRWDKIHSRNRKCRQEQILQLTSPCGCISPTGIN